MNEINLRQKLIRIFMKKLTKNAANKKGQRDENNNLILKEAKITVIMSIILFIIMFVGAIYLIITSEDGQHKNTLIAIASMWGIMFIPLFVYLKVGRKIITDNSIISRGLIGKKIIEFDSIETIEGKNNGNNFRLILRGNGKKIMIPAALDGFSEFLEILEKKVGQERCRDVKLEFDSFIK